MPRLFSCVLVVASCLGVSSSSEPLPATSLTEAAAAFVGTLGPAERRQALLPFDSDQRFTFYYTPVERGGLPFKTMSPSQKEAALALLRVGLSEKGFDRSETIRRLEEVLFAIEGSSRRDPELYFVTVFGQPVAGGTWGLRYEGHHLSYHWTIVNGELAASSPQFLGANPADVREGPMKGTRALAPLEDLGRAFLGTLTRDQRQKAVVSSEAPRDILTTNARQAAAQEDHGVRFGELTAEQRGLLMSLLEEHANVQPPAVAAQRMSRLREAGMEDIRFAWMGGAEKGQGHYYRIQGPTFLVEYDNTQNDANHIHSVWRDFDGDFGRDLLSEHYRAVAH